ncbi:MAG: methionine adenosyltransferase [Candidatus Bilamarchaeaceae archaeon]
MKRNIVIERSSYLPAYKRRVELAERKGVGHPDTLIDGIMEEISKELSKEYLNEFGGILHHNVDKGQICGGATEVNFGGGVFTKPIYILLGGRATGEVGGKKIPVQHIAVETAKRYLKNTIRHLDVECDVELESRISSGSAELIDLLMRKSRTPLANDTSFGMGFAPLDELEKVVLNTERYLNSIEYKKIRPFAGEDIKVMGLRQGNKIKLTVAIAFVSKYILDIEEYLDCKRKVLEDLRRFVKKITKMDVDIYINTADDIKRKSIYMTLTGTSAEMGDDGSVGRGNRANGLITPFRGMSIEAAAGKNPVNHVGKVYSVLATKMAREIAEEYKSIEDITVGLLSQIGKPIDQPKVASVTFVSKDFEKIKSKVRYLIDKGLEEVTEITPLIISGKISVF